jgi:hypothetical protein
MPAAGDSRQRDGRLLIPSEGFVVFEAFPSYEVGLEMMIISGEKEGGKLCIAGLA